MVMLLIGLTLFIGVHLLPSWHGLRARLITRIGHGAYKAFFSIIAALGLLLLFTGYADSREIIVYPAPSWGYFVVPFFMLPASILLAIAYVPNNLRHKIKHPMLIAVKLWAIGHLLANGDVASLILFGSLLAFAVFDMISSNRRNNIHSKTPGKAVKHKIQPMYMNVVAIASGLALFVLLIALHWSVFGLNPLRWH